MRQDHTKSKEFGVVVIYGDNTHVTVVHTAPSAATPAIASGATSTAVGSHIAMGDGTTSVGSQAVHGNDNTVAGHDMTTPAAKTEPAKPNWWRQLRARGMIVALSTITAGAVGVFTWLGWKPWE